MSVAQRARERETKASIYYISFKSIAREKRKINAHQSLLYTSRIYGPVTNFHSLSLSYIQDARVSAFRVGIFDVFNHPPYVLYTPRRDRSERERGFIKYISLKRARK